MFSLASWFKAPGYQYVELSETERTAVKRLFLFVLTLSSYHFFRIGIPALSGNTETSRFTSLSNSGLFGVPGRMVLFGLPIMAVLVIIKRDDFSKYFIGSVLFAWLISRIFLGFKGGILEILILALVALVSSNFKFRVRTGFYLSVCLFLGSLYALWIGNRYQSLSGRTLNLEYFLQRLTNGAALPQWTSLDQGSWLTSNKNPIQIDLQYFLSKYFTIGSQENLTYDKLISTYIYGTPRSLSAFIVPVTIGGSAYLVSSVGLVVAPILIVLLGSVYAAIISRLVSFRISKLLPAVTFILGITVFFSNGNLVYVMINYSVVCILLILLLRILRFVDQGEKFNAH